MSEALTRYKNLSPEAQASLHTTWQFYIVDDPDWADPAIEGFKSHMKTLGVDVQRVWYSLSYSQGDGASWEGRVDDWPTFLTAVGIEDLALTKHAQEHFKLGFLSPGRYFGMECEYYMPLPENDHEFLKYYGMGGDLLDAVLEACLGKYTEEELEAYFLAWAKQKAEEFYVDLRNEHEYLTSEQGVIEHLDANEMLDEAIDTLIEESEDV